MATDVCRSVMGCFGPSLFGTTLVKSSTIAVVPPERAVDLILKPLVEAEVGAVLMLVYISISIGNQSPPVDRIVPLLANLSCSDNVAV